MRHKVCYITTLPVTLKVFVLKSALYNVKKGNWDITFICNETKGFEEELPPEIRYLPVTLKRGISLSGFKSVVQLYRIFKKENFELVQYSTSNAGCYASIAARLARVPIRLYCQWGLDYPAYSGLKRMLFKTIERIICGCSTNIQPDSFGNLKIAMNDKLYGEDKGEVVGHGSASGVDLTKFDIENKQEWRAKTRSELGFDNEGIVIGYVGRLLRDKGINELLEACKKILEQRNNVYLLIVGDDTVKSGIDLELLDWAETNDNVIFTGFTSETEKYYAVMDIFTLPSYHEGFGMSVIEAEAMAIPVVVSDIPGPRESTEEGNVGVLVRPKDAKSLYDGLTMLLDETAKRKEYGSKGYHYAINHYEQNELLKEIYDNRMKLFERITH